MFSTCFAPLTAVPGVVGPPPVIGSQHTLLERVRGAHGDALLGLANSPRLVEAASDFFCPGLFVSVDMSSPTAWLVDWSPPGTEGMMVSKVP